MYKALKLRLYLQMRQDILMNHNRVLNILHHRNPSIVNYKVNHSKSQGTIVNYKVSYSKSTVN